MTLKMKTLIHRSEGKLQKSYLVRLAAGIVNKHSSRHLNAIIYLFDADVG